MRAMQLDPGNRLLPAVRQLGPFAVTALTAWVAVLFDRHISWPQYAVSLFLLTISWTYGVWAGFHGRLWAGTVFGSLGYLAAVGVLRNSAGGSNSGVSIVSLLPIFQTALYVRDRRALWIVLAALTAFYLVPLAAVGPPEYPVTGYHSALLAVAVSSIVGLVTHGLVADIRARAHEARRRERMLARVSETTQSLFQSLDPRHDACRAIKEVSEAMVVGLYEPDPLSLALRMTTTTETPDVIASGAPATPGSAADQAFRTRQPVIITENIESRIGNLEIWRADGAPTSALYQPLLKRDVPVGVLFVGWSEKVKPDGPRVIVASLLAHEIAAVIDRADEIHQLTDDALTDALTGLPNRRAWNARLELALKDSSMPVAVAMFDIDHFKQFNDTHGHPAGDRLLRETAARWRSELRAGDFLARLGGEEFALLLTGEYTHTAPLLVERLRRSMPGHETCSAGIAIRAEGDTPELLLSRADEALYEAKAGGRDRTVYPGQATPSA
jgi:diguanylate cyclase (GGDEF)-like protein